MSNVIAFDRRNAPKVRTADAVAAQQALDKFVDLMKKHGCRWIQVTGYTPDDRLFTARSHNLCDGSVLVDVGFRGRLKR